MLPLVSAVARSLVTTSWARNQESRPFHEPHASVQADACSRNLLCIHYSPFPHKVKTPLREKKLPPVHHHIYSSVEVVAQGITAPKKNRFLIDPHALGFQASQNNTITNQTVNSRSSAKALHINLEPRNKLTYISSKKNAAETALAPRK